MKMKSTYQEIQSNRNRSDTYIYMYVLHRSFEYCGGQCLCFSRIHDGVGEEAREDNSELNDPSLFLY